MKNKQMFAFLILIPLAVVFYWYQIRPAQIKHDCSWVKQHSDSQPAIPAMTKEELIEKGIIRSCKAEIASAKQKEPYTNFELGTHKIHRRSTNTGVGIIFSMTDDVIWEATSCIEDGDKVIEKYASPKKEVPAKDWHDPATTQQYTFCLHDKGL